MKLVFDLCQSTIQKASVFRLFQAMEKPPIWDVTLLIVRPLSRVVYIDGSSCSCVNVL